MTAIKFVPPRVPIADSGGFVTREWYLFLQGVFGRVGGAIGPSTADLNESAFEDAGSSETVALLFSVEQAARQSGELSSLRDQVAELQKQIDSIRQGTIS